MSDGKAKRWVIATIVLLYTAIIAGGFTKYESQRDGGSVQGQSDPYQEHNSFANSANGEVSANTLPKRHPCNQTNYSANPDLCQQWRMAESADELTRLTRTQIIVTGIEIALLMAVLFYTARATGAAARANEISQKALTATQWTRVEPPSILAVTSPFDWQGNNLVSSLTLDLTNSGVGPAIDVAATGRVFNETKMSLQEFTDDLIRRCETDSAGIGKTIRPGDVCRFPMTLAVLKDDVDFFFHAGSGKTKNIIPFVICYCYRGIFDEKLEKQWGLYLVGFGNLGSAMILDKVPIDPNGITIVRAPTNRWIAKNERH